MASSLAWWNGFEMSFLIVVVFTVLPTYIRRRHTYPLSLRNPNLAAFEILMICVGGIFTSAVFAFPGRLGSRLNCSAYFITVEASALLSDSILMCRWVFLVMKDVQQQKLSATDLQCTSPSSKTMRFTKLGSWVVVLLCVVPFFAAFINLIASNIPSSSIQASDPACLQQPVKLSFSVVVVTVYPTILTIVAFVLLSKKPDSIALKAELGSLIMAAFVFGVLQYLANNLSPWYAASEFVVFMLLLSFPLLLSFRNEQEKNKENVHKQGSSMDSIVQELLDTINSPHLRQLFKEHLEQEYSLENLSFYENCVVLEKLVDQRSVSKLIVLEKIRSIRDAYIVDSAANCVNISYAVRIQVLHDSSEENLQVSVAANDEMWNELVKSLFGRAKDEIFQLMARDSFGRFKRTMQYLQAIAEEPNKKTSSLGGFSFKSFSIHTDTSVMEPLITS